jgi:hypothetical protein
MRQLLFLNFFLLGISACATTIRIPAPALMTEPASLGCLTALSEAAENLTGQKISFSPDAFTTTEVMTLQTVGAVTSGRILAPNDALLLQTTNQGCQLVLRSNSKATSLKGCTCKLR